MNAIPADPPRIPLSVWQNAAGAAIRMTPERHLSFADTTDRSYHLMILRDPALKARETELFIRVKPSAGCDAELYVNQWGGVDVCRIGADGAVLSQGIAREVTVAVDADGWLDVRVAYHNSEPSILIGSSRGQGGQYAGRGAEQFVFARIDIALPKAAAVPEVKGFGAATAEMAAFYRSQWQQDRYVFENLLNMQGGTFFEVGAHEGEHLSNTFFFEKALGWKGILVEMQPRFFPGIPNKRQGAQCFNCGLASEAMELLYLDAGDRSGLLRYFEPAAVVYLENHYRNAEKKPEYKVHWVKVRPTMDVLAEAGVSHIDYFSLDVEGAEMTILRSLDFSKVTIDLFSIEDNVTPWVEHRALLEPLGYTWFGAQGVDAFFLHQRLIDRLTREHGAAHVAAARALLRPLSAFDYRVKKA